MIPRLLRFFTAGVIAFAALHTIVSHPYSQQLWWLMRAPAPQTYVVPVQGIARASLRSSFGAPRSGNRKHHGIDILAARGTPVLAAADGFVVSTRPNRLGGTVVWILGSRARTYYYAHLDQIGPEIRTGRFVRAGEWIGRVGTSGNAQGGPPHLHFGIYQNGPIDPYPLLKQSRPETTKAKSAVRRSAVVESLENG